MSKQPLASSKRSLGLEKFSPLSEEMMEKIIADMAPDMLQEIKDGIKAAIRSNPGNKKLLREFEKTKKDGEPLPFLRDNIVGIAKFLNDCGLVGYLNENKTDGNKDELKHGNYLPGALFARIILAYLKEKEGKEKHLHTTTVIENKHQETESGSMQHSALNAETVFNEPAANQISEVLKKAAQEADKRTGNKNSAFTSVFVLETLGTTGGNHFVTIVVNKKEGDTAPSTLIYDPSAVELRSGGGAAENSVASGWNAQTAAIATVKKALEDAGMEFKNENLKMNSAPVQTHDRSYCETVACEMANIFASMPSEKIGDFLTNYFTFDSPYGGKTEAGFKDADGNISPITLENITKAGGFVPAKNLYLPPVPPALLGSPLSLTHFALSLYCN